MIIVEQDRLKERYTNILLYSKTSMSHSLCVRFWKNFPDWDLWILDPEEDYSKSPN